jgi:hypothetical protein
MVCESLFLGIVLHIVSLMAKQEHDGDSCSTTGSNHPNIDINQIAMPSPEKVCQARLALI